MGPPSADGMQGSRVDGKSRWGDQSSLGDRRSLHLYRSRDPFTILLGSWSCCCRCHCYRRCDLLPNRNHGRAHTTKRQRPDRPCASACCAGHDRAADGSDAFIDESLNAFTGRFLPAVRGCRKDPGPSYSGVRGAISTWPEHGAPSPDGRVQDRVFHAVECSARASLERTPATRRLSEHTARSEPAAFSRRSAFDPFLRLLRHQPELSLWPRRADGTPDPDMAVPVANFWQRPELNCFVSVAAPSWMCDEEENKERIGRGYARQRQEKNGEAAHGRVCARREVNRAAGRMAPVKHRAG